MRLVFLTIAVLLIRQSVLGDVSPDPQTFEQIASTHARLIKTLGYDQGELRSKFIQPPIREDYYLHEKGVGHYDEIWMTIKGPLQLTFFRSPLRFRSVYNRALEDYLKSNEGPRQQAPKLSPDQAFAVAEEYLKKLDYKLGSGYLTVAFCWMERL